MPSSPVEDYTNTRFRSAVLLDNSGVPGTPAAGQSALYAKSNKGLYLKTDSGEEQKLNTNLLTPSQMNLLSFSIPPLSASQPSDVPTTGRAVCVQIPWHTTETVATYYTYVNTAGATLSATGLQNSVWLCTGAGVLIPNSATANQSTSWTSTGLKTYTPSGGPITVTADPLGYIYACILMTGTTCPIMRGQNPSSLLANLGLVAGTDPLLFFRNSATQTAPGNIIITTGATVWNGVFVGLSA